MGLHSERVWGFIFKISLLGHIYMWLSATVKVFENVSKIALSSAPRMLFKRLVSSADNLFAHAVFASMCIHFNHHPVSHSYSLQSGPLKPPASAILNVSHFNITYFQQVPQNDSCLYPTSLN